MNLELLEKSNQIIYSIVAGSHSYGLSTPKSDVDIRGIFIHSPESYLGLNEPVAQVSNTSNDICYYSLKRFFELAKDCNPNIIELLWTPEDCIKTLHPLAIQLINNRNLFISKKCYHTFSGYAFAQIKKAKGANKMVHNPQLAIKPKKEDFCWVIRYFEGKPTGLVLNGSPVYDENVFPCRPVPLSQTNINLKEFHVAGLEHVSNTYRLYHYGKNSKGVFRGDDMLVCENIPIEDEIGKFYGLLIYNVQEYEKALNEHRKYNDWMTNRNESRWVDQEKGLLNYDQKNMCHCVRLLISGENILTQGEPIVRFTGEQKDYLMKIRSGQFDYEDIMKNVEDRMQKLEVLYNTSTIPHSVNQNKIEELYRELSNQYHSYLGAK